MVWCPLPIAPASEWSDGWSCFARLVIITTYRFPSRHAVAPVGLSMSRILVAGTLSLRRLCSCGGQSLRGSHASWTPPILLRLAHCDLSFSNPRNSNGSTAPPIPSARWAHVPRSSLKAPDWLRPGPSSFYQEHGRIWAVSAAWTGPSIAVAVTPWAGICPRAPEERRWVPSGLRPLLPNKLGPCPIASPRVGITGDLSTETRAVMAGSILTYRRPDVSATRHIGIRHGLVKVQIWFTASLLHPLKLLLSPVYFMHRVVSHTCNQAKGW
ncbi:hypothetical protein BDP55DRAFT_640108 [Colletotrichum godetiae]|uniref:Uncharacterized protein n=1 Tax=Colletotrichum godetiae TaxID=1209918 RepID=A0AAJ0AZ55_9PEZI|nr:uncharacterized protein BDP55DRAFT_640108 [Colletotrichum godetiae]KAK1700988.1 hypothetical protein BDP55DRAFT_640108 [Colletotrichum godetiae]